MSKAVGIDLGTTNSVVAFLEAGEPTVIPNAEGGRTTPSIVGFAKSGEVLVGEVAKRQAITNPDRTIRSVKRQMGTSWTIDIDGKAYKAQEISARILQKLKRDAEAFLGDTVNQAVITVPAYFDDAQRTATKEAGQIAGLEVLRIINEPTAAALAYGLDKERADQTVLVFDLGGGTFDVSVLEIGEGVFEVKSTSGNTHLGGDDWDQRVMDWLVKTFKDTEGVDLSNDKMALQRLKEAAEKAKIELSAVQETTINLPVHHRHQRGPEAPRPEAHAGQVPRAHRRPRRGLQGPLRAGDQGLRASPPSDIDHVVLVGGSTRMPAIYDLVVQLAGKEPHKGVNPDEVVAVGAAIQAGVLEGRGEGHPAPRRHAAQPRHRDQGRDHAPAHRAQHDDPDQALGDLHDRRGQPAVGRDPRPPGRARHGDVQQDARQVPARRPAAGAPRRAADRGRLRHRRQRHRARLGQGPRHRAGSSRSPSPARPRSPRTTSSAWSATPSSTRPRTASARRRPRRATTPTPSSTRPTSS